MKSYTTLSIIVFLFIAPFSFGQTQLFGTVFNSKEKPVAKALIYLDSINSNVKTDNKGYFKVLVPSGIKDINVFSSKYGLLSSPYNGETKMNFIFIDGKLSSKERGKDSDLVSVGYDEVDQKYVAIRVESFQGEENIDALRFQTIYQLIANRLSGVRVTPDNQILIRGVSSLISPQDPLFVVDGSIVFSIDHILPVDVKTVSVLKGSDAAIYGSRGANGVILITTKK
jgi:TonB-dependent SusC/RagA subfamily outer membrane receptor